METTLILKFFTWVGATSYIGSLFINAGTWKADVLWGLAVMFGGVKLVRYCMKTWQDFRKGEIEIKIQRKKIK